MFKDEVRQAGRELGIPERLVSRQPFPGPGLAIRIIGAVTPEKVKMVQQADAIYREEVEAAGAHRALEMCIRDRRLHGRSYHDSEKAELCPA